MMDHTNKEKSEADVSSGVRSRLKATSTSPAREDLDQYQNFGDLLIPERPK
jgi:hypothetical protein